MVQNQNYTQVSLSFRPHSEHLDWTVPYEISICVQGKLLVKDFALAMLSASKTIPLPFSGCGLPAPNKKKRDPPPPLIFPTLPASHQSFFLSSFLHLQSLEPP